MSTRYKLILSSKNLYKEIDIPAESTGLRIGTSPEADVRLRKELFFSPIDLTLRKNGQSWSIYCSDNLYMSVGDIRRLLTVPLNHGDELHVRYRDANIDVFSLAFLIDFDYEVKKYDLEIDISGKKSIRIGGTDACDIRAKDAYLGKDTLSLVEDQGKLYVVDEGSRYGVSVNGARIQQRCRIRDHEFFSIVGFSFFYRDGKLYTSSESGLILSGLRSKIIRETRSRFQYPKFNRNTRLQYVIPQEELEIQPAPPKPQKPKKNLVMSLIPSIVMLAMTIVLRGIIGGGGSFVIYSAVSMGLGIVMSVVSFVMEKKDYEKETQARIDSYNQYVDGKRTTIEAARSNELRIRNLTYQSLDEGLDEAFGFGKRLFERTQGDIDYLHIYLGKGRIESSNPVKFTKQEFADTEDPLAAIPEKVSEQYRYLENAPIISNFYDACGIGLVGSRETLQQMLKNISLDIAIRHFYNEVKMVYVLGEADSESISWIRWLRNVENDRLDIRNIACDEESVNVILEDLYVILTERELRYQQNKDVVYDSQYVVFAPDTSKFNCHPVSRFLRECNHYGFTFVFFEEYEENIPQGCTEIIRLDNQNGGTILNTANADVQATFIYPTISDTVAEDIALKLGAVNVDEVSLEGELTKNITMFEMLGILAVEDINLHERWERAKVYKSMAAPLGVKNKGQMVYLDISDKGSAHGPHGLVAGTTGSGKSEILQTYILSMATLFHPYEVGFVLIDFKGGGMANQFEKLPHLIGTITNIDGREIKRSLLSIKAELVKRQELFKESGVQHINEYIKLYKAGKVSVVIPHLIMIVDEFAELKQEYPDFMKELISAARIGRTLGFHLILATQKPAGVVDPQIWSNSKFKLCLKVQTKEDSNEVIKTPLAAEIVEPGRAYFQVGNNEIFDLFQSAYSGATVPVGNDSKDRIFSIYERNLWGRKTLKYTNKKASSNEDTTSQLQAIVSYVNGYCEAQGIARLPGICLPALPERVDVEVLSYDRQQGEAGILVPVGVYDDPELQRQGEVVLELSKDNVYIVGSAQVGKTVMLQTICYGLIRKYTPKEVNLYLVDCGSMVLRLFEESNHVGGVVLSNEEEKCRNLFKMLNTMVIRRKKTLSSKGVGNYAAYLEAGFEDMPMAVVMIDNMAAFKEYFPEQAEELGRLSREAQGVGISFVITAAAANAMNYRALANFGKKLVLNCNDTGEYSNIFGHCKATPREYPGSGLLMMEKRILDYQVALVQKDAREKDRSDVVKEFITARNGECSVKAVKIPMVPEKLFLANTMAERAEAFCNRGIIPVGMSYATVDLVSVNLGETGSLTLLGDTESREAFLFNWLALMSKTAIYHEVQAVVIDDKAKKLRNCSGYGFVRQYTYDPAEGLALINNFCESISERKEDEDLDDIRMLVINNAELLRRICADKRDSRELALALKSAAEAGAFILLSGIDNQPVGFNASEVLKTIKEERRGILFAPITESKLYEISGRLKADANYGNGTGYLMDGTAYSRIKIFDREV